MALPGSFGVLCLLGATTGSVGPPSESFEASTITSMRLGSMRSSSGSKTWMAWLRNEARASSKSAIGAARNSSAAATVAGSIGLSMPASRRKAVSANEQT